MSRSFPFGRRPENRDRRRQGRRMPIISPLRRGLRCSERASRVA